MKQTKGERERERKERKRKRRKTEKEVTGGRKVIRTLVYSIAFMSNLTLLVYIPVTYAV